MNKNLFFNKNLINTMKNNCKNTINFLIEENIDFFLTAEKEIIKFEPQLPNGILPNDNELVIFHIINYGLENIHFENDNIVVEMGFGTDNFGSTLTIPLWSVFQIHIGNNIQKEPLFINILGIKSTEIQKYLDENEGVNKSKNIFLNNPDNNKLFN
jgi:hypothetical protein